MNRFTGILFGRSGVGQIPVTERRWTPWQPVVKTTQIIESGVWDGFRELSNKSYTQWGLLFEERRACREKKVARCVGIVMIAALKFTWAGKDMCSTVLNAPHDTCCQDVPGADARSSARECRWITSCFVVICVPVFKPNRHIETWGSWQVNIDLI